MDSELAQILERWDGAWRYPRLWVLLTRRDGLETEDARRHLLEGLALPFEAPAAWRELLESGEFAAAARMLACASFLAESGRAPQDMRGELEQARARSTKQLLHNGWLLRRRALTVGLGDVADNVAAMLREEISSCPRALQGLRRAEEEVERAEADAFQIASSGPAPKPKPWPYEQTPLKRILEWFLGASGPPTSFKEWLPKDGDMSAQNLVGALWGILEQDAGPDAEAAERFGQAFVQFLGCSVPSVEVREEPWCVRVGLPGMAPSWLPSFMWQPRRRMDVLIARNLPQANPPANPQDSGPVLLLDPFGAVERPARGLITLPASLLLQLLREPVDARAHILMAAWGRQVELSQVLPQHWTVDLDGRGPSWPGSELADSFLGSFTGKPLALEASISFLQQFFACHGVRCDRSGDLTRIALFAGGHPSLLLSFVRLLLGRAARKGGPRPLVIGTEPIEEVRASADWSNTLERLLAVPLAGNAMAWSVVEQFAFELKLQKKPGNFDDGIRISREEIAQYAQMSCGDPPPDNEALQASLGVLEGLGLITPGPDTTASYTMTVALAELLATLMEEDTDVTSSSTTSD